MPIVPPTCSCPECAASSIEFEELVDVYDGAEKQLELVEELRRIAMHELMHDEEYGVEKSLRRLRSTRKQDYLFCLSRLAESSALELMSIESMRIVAGELGALFEALEANDSALQPESPKA